MMMMVVMKVMVVMVDDDGEGDDDDDDDGGGVDDGGGDDGDSDDDVGGGDGGGDDGGDDEVSVWQEAQLARDEAERMASIAESHSQHPSVTMEMVAKDTPGDTSTQPDEDADSER